MRGTPRLLAAAAAAVPLLRAACAGGGGACVSEVAQLASQLDLPPPEGGSYELSVTEVGHAAGTIAGTGLTVYSKLG